MNFRTPILKLALLAFFLLQSVAGADEVLYFTDTEGKIASLETILNHPAIEYDKKNGTVKIRDGYPDLQIVFGGDLTDRGADSIELIKIMTLLKKQSPSQVTFIWGNRDLNKLRFMQDLAKTQNLSDAEYVAWLKQKISGETLSQNELSARNTLEYQVQYWLESHSAKDALSFHREGLLKENGKEISLAEAAADYVKHVSPGGDLFELLKLGQLAHTIDGVVYVHGGITNKNIGQVPGDTTNYSYDIPAWFRRLNEWGKSQLEKTEEGYLKAKTTKDILKVSRTLSEYGDGIYDANAKSVKTGQMGRLFYHDISLIYQLKSAEDGNTRLPDKEVMEILKAKGFHTVIVGHQPSVGSLPTPLRSDGFLQLMADTSFGSRRENLSITIKDGVIHVSGKLENGENVTAIFSANQPDKFGMTTKDGFTIIGKTDDGKYVASKFGDKRAVLQIIPDESQLSVLRNPERTKHQELLLHYADTRASLEYNGKHFPTEEKLLELIDGRKPLVISGGSKFGQLPLDSEALEKEIRIFVDSIDPSRTVLFTGGTDNGVEGMIHRAVEERNKTGKKKIEVIGFIQGAAIPGEIGYVKNLVLAADAHDWLTPLKRAIQKSKELGGAMVSIGGGNVVHQGIDEAVKLKLPLYLMGAESLAEGSTGGASVERSAEFKGNPGVHTFKNFEELDELLHLPKNISDIDPAVKCRQLISLLAS